MKNKAQENIHSSDIVIWNELRQGNESVFRDIYIRHVNLLYNYGFKFTSDKQITEDCIQEVFVDIFRNRKNLSTTDNIKLYLFKALRRRIFKEIKKRKITPIQDDIELSFEPAYMENEFDGVNKLLINLQHLPPRQKEVIFLRFYEEMEYKEICQVMDMNYQSVRNLMHRAMQSLREKAEREK